MAKSLLSGYYKCFGLNFVTLHFINYSLYLYNVRSIWKKRDGKLLINIAKVHVAVEVTLQMLLLMFKTSSLVFIIIKSSEIVLFKKPFNIYTVKLFMVFYIVSQSYKK